MSRKTGAYQKRKVRRDRFQDILFFITILLIAFILVGYIVSNVVTVRRIRQNSLEEYIGSYTVEMKRTYGKNSHYYYRITLDNGDVLAVSTSALENGHILEEKQVLAFRYAKEVRRALFSADYTVLSMHTADGEVTLVNVETTHQNAVRAIWVFSILLAVWLLLFGGLFFLYYLALHDDKRHTKRIMKHPKSL